MSITRIACLAVPGLALRCELAERPSLANEAIALSNEAGTRVVDLTEAAAGHGVRRGMTLREATGACPLLGVLQPRPALVPFRLCHRSLCLRFARTALGAEHPARPD